MTSFRAALTAGSAGAAALTALHETARRLVPRAPQVNVIGERAIERVASALGREPPPERKAYFGSLLGELLSNSAYYALVGAFGPRRAPRTGLALGAAAGLGALVLPPRMGLGRQPTQSEPRTKALTVAWYTLGGWVAGAAYRRLLGSR